MTLGKEADETESIHTRSILTPLPQALASGTGGAAGRLHGEARPARPVYPGGWAGWPRPQGLTCGEHLALTRTGHARAAAPRRSGGRTSLSATSTGRRAQTALMPLGRGGEQLSTSARPPSERAAPAGRTGSSEPPCGCRTRPAPCTAPPGQPSAGRFKITARLSRWVVA